jgi:hypothetical protein
MDCGASVDGKLTRRDPALVPTVLGREMNETEPHLI